MSINKNIDLELIFAASTVVRTVGIVIWCFLQAIYLLKSSLPEKWKKKRYIKQTKVTGCGKLNHVSNVTGERCKGRDGQYLERTYIVFTTGTAL